MITIDDIDFAVGDEVNYSSIIGQPPVSFNHKITNIQIELKGKNIVKAIAWITDKRGAVSLQALSKTKGD